MGRLRAALWAALVVISGCTATPQSDRLLQHPPEALASPVLLTEVPFFAQEKYQCGPAALSMLLQASGIQVTPSQLVDRVYVPARQGSLQIEMISATRDYGRLAYQMPPSLERLLLEVKQGRPVLVMQNLGVSWYQQWHYAVVVGYDLANNEIVLHSGLHKNYSVDLNLFEKTWQRADHWAVLALKPGQLPQHTTDRRYFDAVAAFAKSLASHPELTREEQMSPAATAYHAGLQRWPNSKLLLAGFGNLLYSNNRKQEAAEVYRQLVRYHPDYAPGHNNLAHILLELGHQTEALKHAQIAVQLGGSKNPEYQSTLRAATLKEDTQREASKQ